MLKAVIGYSLKVNGNFIPNHEKRKFFKINDF